MVEMPRFETSCLETGVKTLVTETGQQLPPSIISSREFAKYGKYVENGTKKISLHICFSFCEKVCMAQKKALNYICFKTKCNKAKI